MNPSNQEKAQETTVILFGSRAKGTANERSDADVGFLAVRALDDDEKITIRRDTAETIGVSEDSIDLVDLMKAPILLQYEVAKHGKLIFGDQRTFLRFRIGAWRRYLDTNKLRRLKLEALKKHYA